MQKIVREKEYRYIHPVFADLERFYALTSTRTLQSTISPLIPSQAQVFDESFKPLQSLFSIYGGIDYNFEYEDKHYEELDLPEYDDKNVILAFSGGKDGTATALWYKEHGYNVMLYHTQGINKSYPDEWKRAKEIAKYLGLPIVIEKIQLDGKLDFIEHPMKNMMIANGAIKWGIDNNFSTDIAFGNYYDGFLSNGGVPFYVCGDDCVDMWEPYEDIVSQIIPGFEVFMELQNFNDTLELLTTDKKLLEMCQSCIGAQRFREFNRKHVAEKYGVSLMPHRCGVCWKCAAEYIYMSDHDVLEYNEAYYKHCVELLKKHDKKENGVDFTNIKNLWKDYFTYDIMLSKWSDILNFGKRKKRGS